MLINQSELSFPPCQTLPASGQPTLHNPQTDPCHSCVPIFWQIPGGYSSPSTHMSGECTVLTCPAYSSLSSMGMRTRRPSFSSSLSMMQERGAVRCWSKMGISEHHTWERDSEGRRKLHIPSSSAPSLGNNIPVNENRATQRLGFN